MAVSADMVRAFPLLRKCVNPCYQASFRPSRRLTSQDTKQVVPWALADRADLGSLSFSEPVRDFSEEDDRGVGSSMGNGWRARRPGRVDDLRPGQPPTAGQHLSRLDRGCYDQKIFRAAPYRDSSGRARPDARLLQAGNRSPRNPALTCCACQKTEARAIHQCRNVRIFRRS